MGLEAELNKQFEDEMKNSSKVNIMVVGGTGVGKSSLVNAVFGKEIAETGIGKPITRGIEKFEHPDLPIVIFDTEGYEIIEGQTDNSNFEDVVIAKIRELQKAEIKDQIHLVWYCISAGNHRITEYDIENIRMLTGLSLKLCVVFTKCDTEPLDDDGKGVNSKAFRRILQRENISSPAFETMISDDEEKLDLPVLVEWSSEALDNEELKQLFIGAQISNIDLKDRAADKIILSSIAAASAAAVANPIPMSDSVLIVPIQLTMAVKLSKTYGFNTLGQSAMSLLKTQIVSLVGRQLVAGLTKLVPVLGQVINGAVAGGLTAGLGYALKNLYKSAYLQYLNTGEVPDWASLFSELDIMEFIKSYQKYR